jgi:hypothetical protein
MRATRDLLRRRLPLTRERAERLAHVQKMNRQDHRPEFRQPLADQATREGVAARYLAPAGQQNGDVARALLAYDAQLLNDMEVTMVQTATPHAAQPLYRLPSVPGLGTIVRVVVRSALHDLTRCPRVQEVVSYGRLVTWAKASAGTRDGTAGATVGHA